jgi:hypothetical protein
VRHLKPVAVVLLIFTIGCAGNLRDNVRKSALVTADAALGIDQLERQLWALRPPGYTPEKHLQATKAIILMLTAVRTYERAARAWPANLTMPVTIPQAMADALSAIVTVQRIFEGIPAADSLLLALKNTSAAIGGQQ